MQVTLMRLTSNMEYLIVPKGTKFMGSGKLGLTQHDYCYTHFKHISFCLFYPFRRHRQILC